MSSDQPKVSIVILNWNSYEVTRDCFLSLRNLAYPNFEVVLVDNGSIDSSAEKLAQEFPETRVIKNDRNLGFTGGNKNSQSAAPPQCRGDPLRPHNYKSRAPTFPDQVVPGAARHAPLSIVDP